MVTQDSGDLLCPGGQTAKTPKSHTGAGLLSSDVTAAEGSERTQGSAQKLKNRSPSGRPQISSWLRLHRPECVVELPADNKGEKEEPTNTHDKNPNHHQTASKLKCHQVTASHWESVRNEASSRRCPESKALQACVHACLQTAGRCGHPHPERPVLWDSNFCASVLHV